MNIIYYVIGGIMMYNKVIFDLSDEILSKNNAMDYITTSDKGLIFNLCAYDKDSYKSFCTTIQN